MDVDSQLVQRSVGVAEMLVSDCPDEVLATHSLGTCLGVALYDPALGLAGMIHPMVPLARAHRIRAAKEPYVFTDTAMALLLKELFDRGAQRRRIIAKVAGAATNVDRDGIFRIGERNYAVLRRLLWKNDILIAAEDIGGRSVRTLYIEVATGRVFVKKNGICIEL